MQASLYSTRRRADLWALTLLCYLQYCAGLPSSHIWRALHHADFATQDFVLERTLGAVGFMNIASVAPSAGAAQQSAGLDLSAMQRRASQDVTEGGVSARLYAGCLPPLAHPTATSAVHSQWRAVVARTPGPHAL
jgi:hypothetical protein